MERPAPNHHGGTSSLNRLFVRVLVVVGTCAAIWLLSPAVANAAEDPLGAVDDATAAVEEGTDAVTETTQALQDTVDEVTQEASTTVETIVPAAGSTLGTVQTLLEGGTAVIDGLDEMIKGVTTLPTIVPPLPGTVGDKIGPQLPPVDDPVKPNDPPIVGEKRPGPIGGNQRPIEHAEADVAAPTVHRRGELVELSAGTQDHVVTPRDDLRSGGSDRGSSSGTTASLAFAGHSAGRGGIRVPIDDFAAFLILTTLILCLGRWSRHEAEFRIAPVFLSLAERPG